MKDNLSAIYFIHIIFSFSNILEYIPLKDFVPVLVFQSSVLTKCFGFHWHVIKSVPTLFLYILFSRLHNICEYGYYLVSKFIFTLV